MTKIIKQLFEWFRANKLAVKLNKICYTIFRSINKKSHRFSIQHQNWWYYYKKSKCAKYLGLTLDEHLNWQEHIKDINISLTKIGNFFKIIKHQILESNKLLFYNAYIFSKIQYGIEVYGQTSTSTLQKVQIQQNRALKTLGNKDYHTPTKSLHKELNLFIVEDIYKLGVLKFVYKQQNNLLPNIFSQFYIENASNIRQSHGLHVINPTNKFGQRRIMYQGTCLWNSIPAQLRSFHFKILSKKVKQNFISKY